MAELKIAFMFMPTPEDRSNAALLGALGMLSGGMSWALGKTQIDVVFHWGFEPVQAATLNLGNINPGIVFGLIIGVLLRYRINLPGLRQLGYVAAAGLAYVCAWHIGTYVFDAVRVSEFLRLVTAGIAGTVVYSALLGLITIHLLRLSRRILLPWSVIIGGASGAAAVFLSVFGFLNPVGEITFFAIWQGIYAASLAPILRRAPVAE